MQLVVGDDDPRFNRDPDASHPCQHRVATPRETVRFFEGLVENRLPMKERVSISSWSVAMENHRPPWVMPSTLITALFLY
jgi:hypothetical protein